MHGTCTAHTSMTSTGGAGSPPNPLHSRCIPQGCYRGFQDTRTPFYATLASNVINVVLGALFIFGLGWGVRGAAAGTVLAQVGGVRVGASSGSRLLPGTPSVDAC